MAGRNVQRERLKCLDVLGLPEGVSDDEIRKMYKKLALQHHPDKNMGQDATEKFQEISYAYKYLIEGPESFEVDEGEGFTMPFHILVRLFPWLLGDSFFNRSPFGMFGSSWGGPSQFFYMESDDEEDFEYMFCADGFDSSNDEDFFIPGSRIKSTYPRTKEEKEQLRQQQKASKAQTKSTKKLSKKQKNKKKSTNSDTGSNTTNPPNTNPPSYEYYGYTNTHTQPTERNNCKQGHSRLPSDNDNHVQQDQKFGTASHKVPKKNSDWNDKQTAASKTNSRGKSASQNVCVKPASDNGGATGTPTPPPQPKKLGKKQRKKLESEQRRREKEMEAFAEQYLKKTKEEENKKDEVKTTEVQTAEVVASDNEVTEEQMDEINQDTKFDNFEFDYGVLMEKKKSKKAMKNERKRQAVESNVDEGTKTSTRQNHKDRTSDQANESTVPGNIESANYWTSLTESTEDFWGDVDQRFGLNKTKTMESDDIYYALGQMNLKDTENCSQEKEKVSSSWHNSIGSMESPFTESAVLNPLVELGIEQASVGTAGNSSHGNSSGLNRGIDPCYDPDCIDDYTYIQKNELGNNPLKSNHTQSENDAKSRKQPSSVRVFTRGGGGGRGRGHNKQQSQQRKGQPNHFRHHQQYNDGYYANQFHQPYYGVEQHDYFAGSEYMYGGPGYGHDSCGPPYADSAYSGRPSSGNIYYNSRYVNNFQNVPSW